MTQISIILITKNEATRIRPALESAQWADEIIVVDSYSTDQTARIAEEYGAKVLLRRFEHFADQKNFALAQASKPWVFSLDADERIAPALREEIKSTVQQASADAKDGYYVLRDNFIFGRQLRYGGQGQDRQMRLFRKDKARYKNAVHEEVEIQGATGVLERRLAHYPYETVNAYLKKFIQYTDLEVQRMREKGITFSWSRLLIMPWARFIYTYVWKGGFLDGYPGFLFHVLSAFYAFVKVAKLREKTP